MREKYGSQRKGKEGYYDNSRPPKNAKKRAWDRKQCFGKKQDKKRITFETKMTPAYFTKGEAHPLI